MGGWGVGGGGKSMSVRLSGLPPSGPFSEIGPNCPISTPHSTMRLFGAPVSGLAKDTLPGRISKIT